MWRRRYNTELNHSTLSILLMWKVAVSIFRQAERLWYFPLQQLYRCEHTNTCLMWNGHLKHLRPESMEKLYMAAFLCTTRRHFSVSPKIQELKSINKKKNKKKHWVVCWFQANVITARATGRSESRIVSSAVTHCRTKNNTHFSF